MRARHWGHGTDEWFLLGPGTDRGGPCAVPARDRVGVMGVGCPRAVWRSLWSCQRAGWSGVRAGGRWSRRASPWNKAAACGQARAGQGQAFEGEIRSGLFAEWINAVFHTAKNLWRIWTGLAPDGKARAIPLACSERRAGRGVQGPPRASAQRCRRCRPWSQQATESALGPLEMAPAGTGPGRLTCGEDRHVRPGGALDGDGQRSGGVLLLPAVRV